MGQETTQIAQNGTGLRCAIYVYVKGDNPIFSCQEKNEQGDGGRPSVSK